MPATETIENRVDNLERNMSELITIVRKIEDRDQQRYEMMSNLLSDQKVQTEVLSQMKGSIDKMSSTYDNIFITGLPMCNSRKIELDSIREKLVKIDGEFDKNHEAHKDIYRAMNKMLYSVIGLLGTCSVGVLLYMLNRG